MPVEIKAGEVTLNSVFLGDYAFDIPLYQRPYSWEVQHVETLLDDLISAMERSDSKEPTPYFLGSIVLVKQAHNPQSAVVDGQQRLTTLTMLFCVLRDIAKSNGDDQLTEGLSQRVYTPEDVVSGTPEHFRLTLRPRDRKFFQDNVQKPGSIDGFLIRGRGGLEASQAQIFDNVQCLRRRLQHQDAAERRRLVQYINRNCYLVVVATSDEESAHRIFLVLNDRGLSLSVTDILKADVIAKVPDDEQDSYTKQWEDLEAEDRDEFGRLFAHIRTIYRKEKQQETLTREFRRYVLNLDSLAPEGAKSFIDDVLVPYSEVYEDISKAQCESTEVPGRVNDLLAYLKRIDNFDWIPPAMAYFHRNRGNGNNILAFTSLLERLAYGMFIRRVNINGRINRYAQVLRRIEDGGDIFAQDGPLQLTADEKTDILQRLSGGIYNQPRVPMPILLRLDSLLAGEGAKYDRPVISMEHVLPQQPSANSEWLQLFSEDEREYWKHRLANLVLLSCKKNGQASNFEFARKKGEYFQKMPTPFAITNGVMLESEWTPAVLERRQRDLLDAFKREWRLG